MPNTITWPTPLPPKERDCPTCGGWQTVVSVDGKMSTCPACKGSGKAPAK